MAQWHLFGPSEGEASNNEESCSRHHCTGSVDKYVKQYQVLVLASLTPPFKLSPRKPDFLGGTELLCKCLSANLSLSLVNIVVMLRVYISVMAPPGEG